MWLESNLWLHQESHSLLSQTVHSVQKEIIKSSLVWSHFHTKGKKIQNLFLKVFMPLMIPPSHVLNNVCAYHQLSWFTIDFPPISCMPFARHGISIFRISIKELEKWDPDCFVTLSVWNVTFLCQLYHDHEEAMTYPWRQVRSGNCILEEWRTEVLKHHNFEEQYFLPLQ